MDSVERQYGKGKVEWGKALVTKDIVVGEVMDSGEGSMGTAIVK